MNIKRWLIVVVLVAAAAVVLKLTVLRPEAIRVRTAVVERGVVEETVTNTRAGTVKVSRRARLSPQIGGLVVATPHLEGSLVEAGTLLLKLDDRAQQAELALARRSVAAAEAQADEACLTAALAQTELERTTALHDRGIASDSSLDALRTDRDRSRAGCAAAQAAVAQASATVAVVEVQIEFTELRAPFAGVVAEVSTEVGEWITPSPPGVPIPPVIDLLDPASTYVSAPIDEVDAERVEVGQAVRMTVDSRPDVRFAGRVERVAPYVLDLLEQNRTVEIEVSFDDQTAVLGVLPGTSADVEVILDQRSDVLRVPSSAVAENNEVLRLVGGVLETVVIEPGLRNWQFTEVLGGLAEGHTIVAARDTSEIKAGVRAVAR
ncbi:MAG: efflux RND transporter periplasmic adaptor subunit [Thermoanaerobaculales bacterium]|jgi:HlyD family secretion protein|nr:efflux RND transporter periplasmic adaptor subunit [Thermoanaerobaculales bacterium]